MKLFEFEGKRLLQKYQIRTPRGWLYKELPPDVSYPLIAKSQVLIGGRGEKWGDNSHF